MNLPKRVQRDLEAAEAAQAEYQRQHEEAATQVVPSVTALEAAVAEPPVQVTNTEAPEPTPAPPEPPKPDIEHKYRVLQGMYEADVKRFKQQLADLTSQIEEVKRAPAAPTEAPALNKEDVDKFGADLIEMVKRYADEQAEQVEGRLKALELKVNGVAQASARNATQVFFDKIRAAVPDIDDVNQDTRWFEWLGETDELSDEPRQEALNKAQAQLNDKQVVKIVAAFKRSLPPAPPPAPSMVAQVTPSGAGNPPPAPARPKPIISERAVQDFYMDVTRGKYAGREREMAAMEHEINLAAAENRIR